MSRGQTMPKQWLIVEGALSDPVWRGTRRPPRGCGVLLLQRLSPHEIRRLRQLARLHKLTIFDERPRTAARVHNIGQLRRALLARTPLILLSPLYRTTSHPDWSPLPHMRAAALARLGDRTLIALGGMNRRRYAKIAQLGFIGWAGISAFRT